MQHLPRVDEFLDGAGHVLDRDGRVDPVLVVEVDAVGSEALQRPLDDLLDVLGSAERPTRPSTSKPNLLAMATLSRNGASASPTRSSLAYGP